MTTSLGHRVLQIFPLRWDPVGSRRSVGRSIVDEGWNTN